MSKLNKDLPKDNAGTAIQTPSGFTCLDGSASQQASPIASAATEIALVWPANAVQLIILPTSQDVYLRTTSGGDGDGIFPVASNTAFIVPGKAGQTTYIKRVNATTLSFMFTLLKG